MLQNKIILITGGTGSFGTAMVDSLLERGVGEIRIFSRDEAKQDGMRTRYEDPRLKFYIGDVRDAASVTSAMKGVDMVFHAAALKQVPSCEFFPMEAVRTNVEGSRNVLDAAVHGCGAEFIERGDARFVRALRQRDVLPRIRHPSVCEADTERQSADSDRAFDDSLSHAANPGGRFSGVCVHSCGARRPVCAQGAGLHDGRPSNGHEKHFQGR